MCLRPLLLLFLLLHRSSAAALPPRSRHFYFSDYSWSAAQQPSPESIEVSRPLPFDSLIPSCTLPLLSHSFGNTVGLPATVADYSPPTDCTWSRAVLQLSASCNGSQSDQIAAVWLSGAELLRTSTPNPTSDGIFWNVRKDVSRYSSLLQKSNISLAVMLENAVNGVNDGVYLLNLTFMYYNGAGISNADDTFDFPMSMEVSNLEDAFSLNENPADLIVPISASGGEGFWFKIESESDAINEQIQVPANTYRAVIEIYVSFHGNDESWYSNPPNSYIAKNHLLTERGNGAYREIEVKIDGFSVGSVIPLPVIYSGGINPFFWKPLAPIGAFDLPSYQLELTPILSKLLDSRSHTFQIQVTDAISYWLVDANLHLWQDHKSTNVLAGGIRYRNPKTRVQRSEQFRWLDGRAVVQSNRLCEFKGWVSYSGGNFTAAVEHKLVVDNTVEFNRQGKEKLLKVQVEMRTITKGKFQSMESSNMEAEAKYYLRSVTSEFPATMARLENRVEGRKVRGQWSKDYDNMQQCRGAASGPATTYHRYEERDRAGCYRRRVYARDGSIASDTTTNPCGGSAAV
ncbi:peptide-N4-(N-acetyl-beta-glucosaminyl)asparagine amidase A-like [Andrographis paniculata]|uniref:peptide-N4-(N-acetyl-beta- glucosaminyl)asparagine amidase A-like n=1 Tax=Andrographis paniculata TaxID=175694 RepID=UPI0021E941C3|nr:peptide-N4-(N-acetyl-beta-glucosaminyl)asparagine amidase A-like [Andrographis paniculata]